MNDSPHATISLLDNGRLAVTFPYDEGIIASLRGFADRKWNPAARHWEVGLAHLPELADALKLELAQLDRKVVRAYQMYRIRHGRARIVATNTTATVTGINLPLEKIDRATSCFVPGYKFMTRFQKGTWDGKRHLFNMHGNVFPSGLVNRVHRVLCELGVDCDVIPPHEPSVEDIFPATARNGNAGVAKLAGLTPLRDYQQECLSRAIEEKRGIIELATGGGKTLLAAHIIRSLSRSAIFLVHTRDLLYQAIDVLSRELGIPIGCAGDGVIDLQPVTVGTIQTCARAFDIKLDPSPDGEALPVDKSVAVSKSKELRQFLSRVPVAIFDECHHLPSDSAYGLACEMAQAHWRYGLSATPYRADGLDLLMEAALGPKLCSVRASSLIEKGYLVPPRIRMIPVPPLVVRNIKVEYSELYKLYVVENRRRNKLIVHAAQEQIASGKSVLILVMHVRHGRILSELLGNAPLLDGTTPSEERKRILHNLSEKANPIVVATCLADEGINVPSLDTVIVAGAGRSATRVLQRVGRALRKAPGKKWATVIDFMDDAPYLREHASDRLELYKGENAFILESRG